MNDLIAALLKAGVPILSTLVGGPVTTIATAVIGAVADALGTAPTPEAITTSINANPDNAAIVLKKLESDKAANYVDELNARLKDIQDARSQTLSLVREGSTIAWGSPLVSILVVVLFAIALLVFLTKPIQFSESQSALLNITIGTLTAAFTQVVNYWLGSSHGSASKDAALKNIASTK